MHTILLASPDRQLLDTRACLLRKLGYCVLSATSLDGAMALTIAACPDLIVLCHSFQRADRTTFIAELRACHTHLPVLCLDQTTISPCWLIEECKKQLSRQVA